MTTNETDQPKCENSGKRFGVAPGTWVELPGAFASLFGAQDTVGCKKCGGRWTLNPDALFYPTHP